MPKKNEILIRKCETTALVLEGGGFRGMFTAGILDTFLQNQLFFPYAVGVSAGAAYAVSYVSRQLGRNLEVNRRFTADPRYHSFRNYLRKRTIFDWDFVYFEVPQKHVLFDYEAFNNSSTQLKIGITQCDTGEGEFRNANNLTPKEFQNILSASSALPFITQKIMVDDKYYMDGGIAEPIPVEQAFKDGYKRAVVVLTRNSDYRKKTPCLMKLAKIVYAKYPKLAEALCTRANKYNTQLAKLEEMEKEGRIFIIRPQATLQVARIENQPDKLEALYYAAQKEMQTNLPRLEKWLQSE